MTDVAVTTRPLDAPGVAELITELQTHGLRTEVSIDSRRGGAAPCLSRAASAIRDCRADSE